MRARDQSCPVLRGPYLIFGTRLRLVSAPQFSRLRPLQLPTLLFQERARPPEFTGPASFTPALLPQTEPQRHSYAICNNMDVEKRSHFIKKEANNSFKLRIHLQHRNCNAVA